jgi:hypothetical protein
LCVSWVESRGWEKGLTMTKRKKHDDDKGQDGWNDQTWLSASSNSQRIAPLVLPIPSLASAS